MDVVCQWKDCKSIFCVSENPPKNWPSDFIWPPKNCPSCREWGKDRPDLILTCQNCGQNAILTKCRQIRLSKLEGIPKTEVSSGKMCAECLSANREERCRRKEEAKIDLERIKGRARFTEQLKKTPNELKIEQGKIRKSNKEKTLLRIQNMLETREAAGPALIKFGKNGYNFDLKGAPKNDKLWKKYMTIERIQQFQKVCDDLPPDYQAKLASFLTAKNEYAHLLIGTIGNTCIEAPMVKTMINDLITILSTHGVPEGLFKKPPTPYSSAVLRTTTHSEKGHDFLYELRGAAAMIRGEKPSERLGLRIEKTDKISFGEKFDGGGGHAEADLVIRRENWIIGIDNKHSINTPQPVETIKKEIEAVTKLIRSGTLQEFHFITNAEIFSPTIEKAAEAANVEIRNALPPEIRYPNRHPIELITRLGEY